MSRSHLRVALGQYDTRWHDPVTSLARATTLVEASANAGADLVVLPEMCTTGFTMEPGEHAEELSGRSVTTLAALARRCGIHLIAGVATRTASHDGSMCYNSALVFGPGGEIMAEYRKQRLFAYAGEDRVYSTGDAPVVVQIHGVRVAPFICFDLRFPELFRTVSPRLDMIALIANWPATRRVHWDVLTQARAIENQCYMVAVNRTGEGGGVSYRGGSAAYGPFGDTLARTDVETDAAVIVDVDSAEVTRVRSEYPFMADSRPSHSLSPCRL